MSSSWRCPYCQQFATIGDANISFENHIFQLKNKEDSYLQLRTRAIVCPNADCREYVLDASLFKAKLMGAQGWKGIGNALLSWHLKPQSKSRPFPNYIPPPIRQDYEEACLILSGSPKASATLSRRCLQGMIRDFHGITRGRLKDEIDALKGKIDSEVWDAIDAVRSIGNIGAHMEGDISVIIDVDPDEAELLIGLIEQLMEEWYIHRHERAERMNKVVAAAAAKKAAKTPPQTKPP